MSTLTALNLVRDETGCMHALDGPTEMMNGWEVGICRECCNNVARRLSAASERIHDTRLVRLDLV